MGATLGSIVAELAIDKNKWSAGLSGAGKDLSKFGDELSSRLSKINTQITKEATKLVTGKGGSRSEIDRLKDEREEVSALIKERELLLGVRKREVAVAPSPLTDEQKLARIRTQIAEVTAEYDRQGRVGGNRLTQLVEMENRLTQAKQRQAAMIDRTRQATIAEGTAAMRSAGARGGMGARGGAMSGGRPNYAGLAYGLSDAATAYQFGGAKAALIAASNNLPQIGEAVGMTAARFAGAAGAAGRFAGLIARFAGPAGLIASIAVPLSTALIPNLGKTKTSLEEAAEAAERWSSALQKMDAASAERREKNDASKAFGASDEPGRKGAIEKQREEVRKLADELNNAKAAYQGLVAAQAEALKQDTYANRLSGQGPPDKANEIKEADKSLRERTKAREEAEARLRAMTAQDDAKRRREAQDRFDASGEKFREGYVPFERRRAFEEDQARKAEFARRQAIDDEATRSALLSGLAGGRARLVQQRDLIGRNNRVFEGPTAVSRANSMDAIIENIRNTQKADQEKRTEKLIEKADEQIKRLDKLIEAVKNQKPGRPVKV